MIARRDCYAPALCLAPGVPASETWSDANSIFVIGAPQASGVGSTRTASSSESSVRNGEVGPSIAKQSQRFYVVIETLGADAFVRLEHASGGGSAISVSTDSPWSGAKAAM